MSDLPETLPEELVPLTFLVGRWEKGKHAEHWVAIGDVLYGIAFGPDDHFEVLTIESVGGQVRYVAQPGGEAKTIFALDRAESGEAIFLNPAHDEPQRIRYTLRDERRLEAAVGQIQGEDMLVWKLKVRPAVSAPELEEADRTFARAVAATGIEAWVAAFDPQGHQWDDGEGRITPGPAMKAYMGSVLEGQLQWEPVASGLSPGGGLGWTVGTSTWAAGPDQPGRPGAYVTLWRQQEDGSWKVWFDTGNPVGP
jgi:hypothetical protein